MNSLNWIQNYPALSLVFVFIVAFGESLALVGMVVPGAILMVGFGALIAANILPLWPTVLAAFLGAIAGDGLSYYLGARYQQHLAQIWPLSRYPDLIPRGEVFFRQHGAKSVLLGRFFGPLRAIIPAVAGILGMAPGRFFVVNIISAALWAPIYLLPGIIFAASLELASEMTARIALFIFIFLVTFLLIAWLIKHLYLLTTPRLEQGILKLIHWIEHHPRIGKVPGSIINPQQSDVLGLSVIGGVLLLLIVITGLLLQESAHWLLINNLDLVLFAFLQELHHPLLNHLMLIISTLGNTYFLTTIFAMFVIWKLSASARQDNWLVLTHWVAAFLLPLVVIAVIPLMSLASHPKSAVPQSFLPDGELMLAVSLYGFISVYLVQFISQSRRWLVYLSSSICTLFIGFSQLYFSWNGMISVVSGYVAGLTWAGLLGLALRRHALSNPPVRRTPWTLLLVMCLAVIFIYPVFYSQQLKNLTVVQQSRYTLAFDNWMDTGWTALPMVRHDLRGYNQHPFNIQWIGSEETISQVMQKTDWRKADNNKLQFIQWLNPVAEMEQLYIMPHVHNGKYESLLWTTTLDKDSMAVMRLWKSNFLIHDSRPQAPLWYGSVSILQKTSHWGLTYMRTRQEFDKPLRLIKNAISNCSVVQKKRVNQDAGVPDSTVLLIAHCGQNQIITPVP